MQTAAVIGGGSFGTVIANILADNQVQTRIWLRDANTAEEINQQHSNSYYLPSIKLNSKLRASTDLQQCIAGAQVVFIAIPSHAFRDVVKDIACYIQPQQFLISTTKGIEANSFMLMSEVLEEECPDNLMGVISGPNLAKEIAKKELAATVIASESSELRRLVQQGLSGDYFRLYASNDVYGVELGGALKNIYAIVSGFVASMGMGENTKGMIITRSLAEMSRFAVALGANPLTFLGLAGVGDLVVTCMSPLSRNYRVGYAVGSGKTLEQAINEIGEVAEGVNTLGYVNKLATELDIYMPLVSAAYAVLFEQGNAHSIAKSLMLGEHTSDVDFALPQHEI